MAVYFLNMKTFGRTGGSSAVSAAAYRAGERIRDERTGKIYDHSERQDVMHKEIVLPDKLADADLQWARDRATLWNAAESAETRKNARVAREYLVALPVELSPVQRIGLILEFSRELTNRYGFGIDFTIHAPRDFPGSDPRNYHAHLLATTREITPEGFGAKTTLDMNDVNRRARGLEPAINELFHVRARWAAVANEALEEAHIAARIDHRSFEAQGIDREPRPYIPRPAFEMERHGSRSVVADRMREEYLARVQERLAKSAALGGPAHGPSAEKRTAEERTAEERTAEEPSASHRSPEDIRREARENWLRLRQKQGGFAESGPDAPTDRNNENDVSF